MAITAVGAGAPFLGSTTSVTSMVVPMPAGVAVGDLLLMHVVSSVTANPTTPTNWAVFEPNLSIGSPGPTSITYFKWADGTEGSSVTVTVPTGKYEGHIAAYRGVDTTNPKDVAAPTGTQSATTTLAVPPPITTVTAGAMVLLFTAANSASGVVNTTWASANMTERVEGTSTVAATTNPTAALYENILASPGTFQPDVSINPNTSGRSSMRVVALRPAATGPQPPTGLTATPISSTQINLAWTAGANSTAVDIERDGLIIAQNYVGTSYQDKGLSPSTTYSYRLRSVA